jgi:Xaa-Pro aminopeptidase/Xaa-Pro dipeptidase
MEALGDRAQALLVTTPANVRYLTGFTGSNGQVLLCADPVFFTDGRYEEQSAGQVGDIERQIYSASMKFTDVLRKSLGDRDVNAMALEASHVTLATEERLRSNLEGIELSRTDGLVERVREVKDADEVEAIRRAQQIAERAMLKALRAFDGGTERELAMAIEWEMRTTGAEDVSFDTIVASGAHSALPHATPRMERIDLDGVLLIDLGALAGGYCSDTTRTFLGAAAPDPMPRVHEAVVRALEAACAVVRPGVAVADVDAAARTSLEKDGFGDAFVHSTGHGVGLEIHEGPALTPAGEGVLEAGMAITVEPGVYLPGVGGVRVEDLLIVTDDGFENLTGLPRGSELPGRS